MLYIEICDAVFFENSGRQGCEILFRYRNQVWVAAVKDELTQMQGVSKVEGDPADKSVTVEWEAPATEASIRATLQEINYPAE